MIQNKRIILIYIGVLAAFITSCKPYSFRYNYNSANQLIHHSKSFALKPFLKVHLKNGDVCILKDTWQADSMDVGIRGTGKRYNYNRKYISEGALFIPYDSIAIFETNTKLKNPEARRIAALGILTGLDVALGLYCASVPKACFGSCPTFYINEKDNFHYADAEGFSNAIAPSMEYFDIDALNIKTPVSSNFSITMKNEAMETHCLKNVSLLALARKTGERVYQSTPNEFYACDSVYPLSHAQAQEGNITELLLKEDRVERFSLSDSNNINTREEIILNFNQVNAQEQLGLILHFRQTLMTTYFIYNALAYMGDAVSDIFAKIETSAAPKEKKGIIKVLGNIDVYVWNEQHDTWEFQSALYETGPIAINRQIVLLQTNKNKSGLRLKIVLNKGLWRLDYAALTHIAKKAEAITISPEYILNKGKRDTSALMEMKKPKGYLISMPGSEYSFNFLLPDKRADYELFLYSKGYYLEWMRKDWCEQKNLWKLNQMMNHAKRYLKKETKNYKKYEAVMEQQFWNSKIDTKTFSYNEQ